MWSDFLFQTLCTSKIFQFLNSKFKFSNIPIESEIVPIDMEKYFRELKKRHCKEVWMKVSLVFIAVMIAWCVQVEATSLKWRKFVCFFFQLIATNLELLVYSGISFHIVVTFLNHIRQRVWLESLYAIYEPIDRVHLLAGEWCTTCYFFR